MPHLLLPEENDNVVDAMRKIIHNDLEEGKIPRYAQSDVIYAMFVLWLKTQNEAMRDAATLAVRFYQGYVPVAHYPHTKEISDYDWKCFQDIYNAAKRLGIKVILEELDRVKNQLPKSLVRRLNKTWRKNELVL